MSRIQFKSKSPPGPLFVRVQKLLDDLVVVEGQGHGSVHSPGPPGRVPDGAMVRRAPDGVHHPAEDVVPGIDGTKGPAVRGQSLPADVKQNRRWQAGSGQTGGQRESV